MSTFDGTNYYYSGQGVMLVGLKHPVTGEPMGLRPVGNVPEMKVSIGTTVQEHKGSQDGQRATDKRLQTEVKVNFSATLESFDHENLALVTRGSFTEIPAASIVGETFKGYYGLVSSFKKIKASSVVLKQGATTLTLYTDGVTPWDYKLNGDAGSVMINDPSKTGVAPVGLNASVSAGTVGATTALTVPVPAGAVVGGQVFLSGFTGADAADLNGKTATIATITPSSAITVNVNTTAKVITFTTGKVAFLGLELSLIVDYAHAAQYLVDTLTQPLLEYWIRFEGLNTVEANEPVVIDIFKMSNDPLKELSALSDTFQQAVLEGTCLKDDTRLTGSKYWNVRELR